MAGMFDSDGFKSVWYPLSGVLLKHIGGVGEPSAFPWVSAAMCTKELRLRGSGWLKVPAAGVDAEKHGDS